MSKSHLWYPLKFTDARWRWAATAEFHRVLKREFYGAQYGNYKCGLVQIDFLSMYNMGGEL